MQVEILSRVGSAEDSLTQLSNTANSQIFAYFVSLAERVALKPRQPRYLLVGSAVSSRTSSRRPPVNLVG